MADWAISPATVISIAPAANNNTLFIFPPYNACREKNRREEGASPRLFQVYLFHQLATAITTIVIARIDIKIEVPGVGSTVAVPYLHRNHHIIYRFAGITINLAGGA